MTQYECPRCYDEILTNTIVDSKFEDPPTLYCVHGSSPVEMAVISEDDVRQ